MSQQLEISHRMKKISVDKVVINIAVGKSGEPLERAKRALQELTGQVPSARGAKKNYRDFGIHKGEPIAAIVTLRREVAQDFLKRIIAAKANTFPASSFDNMGNISVGIHEHIDIPGTKYNPEIGIVGMNVSVALVRPGYRIARKRNKGKVGKKHRITKDDSIAFFQKEYGVVVS
jgi:large subunit ribosomal protein L5